MGRRENSDGEGDKKRETREGGRTNRVGGGEDAVVEREEGGGGTFGKRDGVVAAGDEWCVGEEGEVTLALILLNHSPVMRLLRTYS